MKTVKILLSACALLMGAAQIDAQEQIFSFVTADMSARSAGLAGASKSLSGGLATDMLANPALAFASGEKFGVAVGYGLWMPSYSASNRISAVAAYNFGRFAVSASYLGVIHSPYDVIDASGASHGTYTPIDMKAGLGLAFAIGEQWSVGADVKYLRSDVAGAFVYSGFAASLYGTWSHDALSVSAGVENLGPAVEGISSGEFSLPSSILLSGAYRFALDGPHGLAADVDLNYFLAGGFGAAGGVEYGYDDMLFARAAYRFSSAAAPVGNFASLGLGFKKWGVCLDAAYLLGTPLTNTVLVTLGYSF